MKDYVFNCCFLPPPPPGEVEVEPSSRRRGNMAAAPPHKPFLIFFDFDETIVDESSDDVVVQAAPGQRLPAWLKDTYQPGHYNEYMQRVLAYMAEKGVTEQAIRTVRLLLGPYHAHGCPRCPENMCKQVIVRDYLARRTQERGRPFQRVFYVGDGANDFCPSLILGPRDTAFARQDYPMHKLIVEKVTTQPADFKATVVPWASGEDVVARLKKVVEER
ncbi:phosphoethanolamine/phosphocholine phosphatase-like [Scleropages formosus]|uniref:Phosphoethanolamine/phosphocholine phosphatase-like n=1 Tax=Scleropages formosus TaxID=113540 RepID=A0A0P7UHS9_SCLFO|nr:phosphoethanolamine/phosphocholine phosphatase-like [Scleropages formosus]